MSQKQKTMLGDVDREVLRFTAGRDVELDRVLIEADCLGSAAHVTMLARMPMEKPLFTEKERARVVRELARIVAQAESGAFVIRESDQDVHLAVERALTERLGDLGRRVHTGRSRNDQVAVDLRLYAREELLGALSEAVALAETLLAFGKRHRALPMVGRTHLQPAMPSSVGLWAAAHAESLLDDADLLRQAYDVNDRCPLGAAASYGVPLPIDRALTSSLLGFQAPVQTVLHAIDARGKVESVILHAMNQVMLTLSRMAEDLILFAMPELGYFRLPALFCTGSSIMPQKRNPDVLELVRGRSARVLACWLAVFDTVRALPSGYRRDLQETKEPFFEGLALTRSCLRILRPLIAGLEPVREKLLAGFTPDVFAADRALERAAEGVPFRKAYDQVKRELDTLDAPDPEKAIRRKTHLGATWGLPFGALENRARALTRQARASRKRIDGARAALLSV